MPRYILNIFTGMFDAVGAIAAVVDGVYLSEIGDYFITEDGDYIATE